MSKKKTTASKRASKKSEGRKQLCGSCRKPGHNARTCPK